MTAITPLQALRRLVDVARLIDADECPELYNQIQAELTVAGAVLTEPQQEPVAYLQFRAAQQWSGIGGYDIEHAEWLETCQQHEIGDDKLPAFPVWTYPVSPEPVAAEPVKHTDDFAHFLSYSGLSGEPADVLEKMRRAFEAARPAETQQPVAWRVTGNFTDLPFKNESSADAYMSGLLANDPNGGYKKLPLFAAPLPEAGSATPSGGVEIEKAILRLREAHDEYLVRSHLTRVVQELSAAKLALYAAITATKE